MAQFTANDVNNLFAYSEIMVNAVEKAKNAVVKIDKYSIFNGIERSTGTGSGFVFSSDGMILTYAYGELPIMLFQVQPQNF